MFTLPIDHMLNGQLKPAYNWQISTQEQFILGYTIHQTTTDTTTLQPHMESLEETLGQMPEILVADAGYGSEENYEYLESNGVEAFVKYNYFHKEQTKKWREDPARAENLHYNEQLDCFYCPMGQAMTFVKASTRTTTTGYKQQKHHYQAQNCTGCPMRGVCHAGKGNRTIEVSPKLMRYKSVIRQKLNSEQGKKYRSQRPVDVEAVFGIIKNNHNFRRFMLRGLDKVEIEAGLLALAHNIRKMVNQKSLIALFSFQITQIQSNGKEKTETYF